MPASNRVVGDDMYGGRHLVYGDVTPPGGTPEHASRDPLQTRQALHAALLGFEHPISGAPMRFHAPLPADMAELVRALRRYRLVEAPRVAGTVIDLEAIVGGLT